MKTWCKKLLIGMGLSMAWGSVQADVWTGAGDGVSYEDALNWNPSTNAFAGSTRDIDGAFTVNRAVDVTVDRTFVQGGATLNVTAGTHADGRAGNTIRNFVGNGSKGTVNVSGESTVYDVGHVLAIAHSSNSDGTVRLTGGTLNVGRGGNSLISGYGGIFTRGHAVSIGGNNGNSGVTGLMEISGGLLKTRTGLAVGMNGTLSIVGSGAGILLGGSNDDAGWFALSADGRLKATVDAGGITRIFVEDKDNSSTLNPTAELQAGSLLEVTRTTEYGGTWTLLEVENGTITNNGIAFAEGVDTNIWSFNVDNSGPNGILTITATGESAPVIPDVTLTVGDTKNQMMRYGLDYERLWYWYGDGLADVPKWSVTDCNVDFIRTAMNSGYELTEGTYDLSAYTKKIIPMMTAMQNENPNIKWFASPRPLNEAYPNKKWEGENVTWQPYPIWVTGATTPISGDYDFNAEKCAEYMIRYLLLMKSYGFRITYMDLTNEWQDNYSSGGKIAPDDVVAIKAVFDDYLENPWPHPALSSSLLLEAADFPLMIGASFWNYSQGGSWISRFTTETRRNAIDIASSHNTDKTGTAQAFADAAKAALGETVEVWETEQHGWKGNSSTSEAMSFSYMIETVRAGFTGLSGWLAIGTTSQGHSYLLNNGSTVTRNVKYYMFKKLSNTSNYGYALDIDQTDELSSTMALIRENLLTVWVINSSPDSVLTEFELGSHEWDGSDIRWTRWDKDLSIDGDETPEGIEGTVELTGLSSFIAELDGDAAYCFEIPLVDHEDNFPFVQAELYTDASGVSVQPCSDTDGGNMVAFGSAGSEISFDLDITKTYTNDVAFRVSSGSANIKFDVYDGTTLLASVDRIATGDAQNWTTVYTSIPCDGGPMDLRIVATGGDWNMNWIQFDQKFYLPSSELDNLALNQTASASNVHSAGYEADKAVDGNRSTRWATSEAPVWLEVDFGVPTSVNGVSFYEYGNRTTAYEIQYSDDGISWSTAFVGGNPDDDTLYSFPTVTASKFRYQSISSTGGPSIYEFELFYNPYYTDSDPFVSSMDVTGNAVSLSWSGVPGSTYALQCSTNLISDSFKTIESGIPAVDGTNSNTMAIPDDSAFYRIILE
ncbi:carbohydrate-binding protein [Pontiellaceae bacterium B12219]|nr:carbohydrate-binding protein [Pontiellaceae bacterium B12219]